MISLPKTLYDIQRCFYKRALVYSITDQVLSMLC